MTTSERLPEHRGSGTHESEHERELRAVLRTLTIALALVAVLAALFTAVNVTTFAVAHGVPIPIAWLLDPMVALALTAVLVTDARLAGHGVRPPAWGTALRWYTAIATLTMNTWTSWFPTGDVGVPRNPDTAGIILHSIPPVLLVMLSEAVAAYRRRINDLIAQGRAAAPGPSAVVPAAAPENATAPCPPQPVHEPGVPAPNAPEASEHPHGPRDEPDPDEQLYQAAYRIDRDSRTRTGRPASIRLLRSELRIGQGRAAQLRTQLKQHADAMQGPAPPPALDPYE